MNLLLHITGEFNVYNVMTAVAICLAEQIPAEKISGVLDGFQGVTGRFQLVNARQKFLLLLWTMPILLMAWTMYFVRLDRLLKVSSG